MYIFTYERQKDTNELRMPNSDGNGAMATSKKHKTQQQLYPHNIFFLLSPFVFWMEKAKERKKNSFLNLVVVCFSHQTQQLLSKPDRLSFVSMTEKLNIHFCGIWNANEWPKPNAFKRQTKYSKQIFCIIANKRFFFFIFIFCISHSCICLLSTFFNNGS